MVMCRSNPAFEPRDILAKTSRPQVNSEPLDAVSAEPATEPPAIRRERERDTREDFGATAQQTMGECALLWCETQENGATSFTGLYFLFHFLLVIAALPEGAGQHRVTWGGVWWLDGRMDGWLAASAAGDPQWYRAMANRRVGFCLSDKKRRRMNLDAFAHLCA